MLKFKIYGSDVCALKSCLGLIMVQSDLVCPNSD